jgi:hypothetical protein
MKPRVCSILLAWSCLASLVSAAEPSPAEVFERRILPIFNSPKPSSCTECHLAGVDLKNYILPSSEQTFLSLRDQGLVDLKLPAESKILKLISMRDPAAKPGSPAKPEAGAALIHEATRKTEFDAFAAWIKACAVDEKLVNAPKLAAADLAEPLRPAEVIRHARKDKLLESFENSIWAMRFRCMSCHIEGTKENDKLRAEHGDQVAWIKQAGPQATLDYLIASKLIDVDKPEESLLSKKPLMEVAHKGGKKFLMGDQGYRLYRAFIEDFAKIKRDEYQTAAALPKAEGVRRRGTDIWLKLVNTPQAWGDVLVQADVYFWNEAKQTWSAKPIATTDRANFAKGRLWQHNLTLLMYDDNAGAPSLPHGTGVNVQQSISILPPGKYMLKAYVDRNGTAAAKPLDETDYAGQVEFEAKWKPGYGAMTVVDGAKLK